MGIIKVEIREDGQPPKVEAEGYNGVGCEAATRPIEEALAGNGAASREYKPEWSQPENEAEEAEEKLTW